MIHEKPLKYHENETFKHFVSFAKKKLKSDRSSRGENLM